MSTMNNIELKNFYREVAAWVSSNDPERDEWRSYIEGRCMMLASTECDRVAFIEFSGEEDGSLWFCVSMCADGRRSAQVSIDVDGLQGTAGKVGLWCL